MAFATVLAGWASADITPEVPCWMGGYVARTQQAVGVHDPFLAHGLALGTPEKPLILITCDLPAVEELDMTLDSGTAVDQFLDGIRGRLQSVQCDQSSQIAEAGRIIARTLELHGLVHTFGTGHSHLLAEELYCRAGGVLPVNVIESAPLMLHEDVMAAGAWERLTGVAGVLLEHAAIDPATDVLVVISNSGRNAVPVEAAEWARARGMPVVAVTSLAHSRSLPSLAPSGKRLYEVASVVLDNLGEPGDAFVQVSADLRAGASSTVIGACLLQCAVLSAIEECMRRGVAPPALVSNNTPGAAETNTRLLRDYPGRLPAAYERLRQRTSLPEASSA
jgi:uncharacterized phosphosugar-binding protein